MRFLFAFVKDGNNLVKIAMDDGKERWMTTSKAVYGFAKKVLKGTDKQTGYSGDEVKVEYTQENGKYNATRIEKIGGTSAPQQETTNNAEFKCSECGKALKDGKYKKCYTCNQKNPVKRTPKSSDGKFRTPEQITRDEIGHMTARTMVALAGVVDPNNITDVMRKVYKVYTELVG